MTSINFFYDIPTNHIWMDGLSRALDILENKWEFEIRRINLQNKPDNIEPCDIALGWGAFGGSVDTFMREQGFQKKALLLAGNATPVPENIDYDIIFYETKWARREYLRFVDEEKTKLVHAFGVNTDIFGPIGIPTPVVWDYIGVGAFANWKHWERMTEKRGNSIVIGYYQDDNEDESLSIVRRLMKSGVMVSNQLTPFNLSNFYHFSRTCYVPADIYGGGERTVLEARSCGLFVEVDPDNAKLKELVEGPIYDHNYYADQLFKGITEVLS